MDKKQAIRLAQSMNNSLIAQENIRFANISNSSKEVWWLDIPYARILDKHTDFITFLLYDRRFQTLYHLEVPKAFLKTHENKIDFRKDKNCISLELSTRHNNRFQNVRPANSEIHFRQFLKNTIQV